MCSSYSSVGVPTSGEVGIAPSHPIPHPKDKRTFSPHLEHSQLIPSSPVCLLHPCPPAPALPALGEQKTLLCSMYPCIFCWSLGPMVSLSPCLCLIRGENFLQGSYKRKGFQDTYEKSRGIKIAEYLQIDSPCFGGTNAFTHLKHLVTASGPLQGPKS